MLERVHQGKLNACLYNALVVCDVATRNQLCLAAFTRPRTVQSAAFLFCGMARHEIFCTPRTATSTPRPPTPRQSRNGTFLAGNSKPYPCPHSPLFVPVTRFTFRFLSSLCVCPLFPAPNLPRTALWGASGRPRPPTWVCAWVDSANASLGASGWRGGAGKLVRARCTHVSLAWGGC